MRHRRSAKNAQCINVATVDRNRLNLKKTDDRPSKSQLKREMLELQALGESLIELSDSVVAALPIPEELRTAIRDARHMTKHGALHRQKQFIGKLMRQIDATPIREALAQRQNSARAEAARFHVVENWRDRLVREGDSALEKFLAEQPTADRQHLRRLIRDAGTERESGAPPRVSRQLFRYINDLMA